VKELGASWSGLACAVVLAGLIGMVGCASLGAPKVQTPGSSGGLVLQNASLNFGSVAVGDSKALTDTLVNNSASSIMVAQATVADTAFKVGSPALPMTLSAGQSVSVSITFSPKAPGQHAANLTISGDNPNQNAVLSVSGTAVSAPQLTVNPSSIDFGTVVVGSSQTQSVTLTNAGGLSLTVSQATLSGTGFATSGLTLPLTLAPGQSTTFSVKYAPSSAGNASGNLAITSSASNPTLNLGVSGTGATPGSLTSGPSSLSFGTVQVGSTKTQLGTLTNSGGSSITISKATATGAGFSISGLNLPLNLAAGQSTPFSVTFAPQTGGNVSGAIAITSTALNPALNVPLSGTAVTPGLLVAAPTSVGFGSVLIGSSQTTSETITNSGGSTVSISQATVTGTGFSLNGLVLPLTLSPGQSTSFSVAFAPQSGGAASGSITVASNASNPTLNVGLSGTAVTPGALSANPSSLGFGSVQTGSNKTLSAGVTNSGGSSVTISQVTASGAGYSVSGITPPVTLGAGQSYTFSVTFAPTVSGSASGTVSVGSNASNPTLSIPLTGTGTTPGSLAVTPSAINFGNVVVGTTKSQTATLSATGAPVTVSSASVSSSEFSVTGLSFPVTLAAGSMAPFTVTFIPQALGTASANITFASNATNPPTVESLSGSGTPAPQHSVALSWNASTSTVAGYNVYRGSVSGGPYSKVNTALDATTTYTDTSVQGGQTYYYVVTAVDGSGTESAYSNQVQAVIPSP
jgi:hypothetical protein